jgi:AcrR family transcriptional regulator
MEDAANFLYRYEMVEKTKDPKAIPGRQVRAPYHHGDLQGALVKAARTILEDQGLAALSLRAVARAAGVSQAAPYHHFADKQALLGAVAAEGFDALAAAMEMRMAKETSATARLHASGLGYVAFAVANPALFLLMFGGGEDRPSADARLTKARTRAYGVLEAAVTATAPAGVSVSLACLSLWARVHGLAKLILEGCISPADYGMSSAETLAASLLQDGLLPFRNGQLSA